MVKQYCERHQHAYLKVCTHCVKERQAKVIRFALPGTHRASDGKPYTITSTGEIYVQDLRHS